MMLVTFLQTNTTNDELGDVIETFIELGTAECDITPFKTTTDLTTKTKQLEYTAKTETKAFLYQNAFLSATHFKVKNVLFEIVGMNDYNEENIICFIGENYEWS